MTTAVMIAVALVGVTTLGLLVVGLRFLERFITAAERWLWGDPRDDAAHEEWLRFIADEGDPADR